MTDRVALVVEDNSLLSEDLSRLLREREMAVRVAESVRAAREVLSGCAPELVLLDFMLPDGTGLDVLEVLSKLRPQPVVVAISGEVGPEESFRLAQAGVRAFLPKPFRLAQVREAVDEALELTPDPTSQVKSLVGKVPIKEVEATVRRAMVGEALAKSRGSIRGAAALLGISRQLLQHILKTPDYEGKIDRS